jgi:hypothetical protein
MSRQPWAFLAVSLALHALVLGGLVWWAPGKAVSIRPPSEPLWMDLQEAPPPPPRPPAPAPAPSSPAASARPKPRADAPGGGSAAPPPGLRGEAVFPSPGGPLASDVPRQPHLRPPVPAPAPASAEQSEQARVAGRVDSLLRGDQAASQVRHGHVDAYFAGLRQAMEQGVGGRVPEGAPGRRAPVPEEAGFVEDRPVPPPSVDRVEVVERYSANTQAVKRDPFGLTPGGQIGRALQMPIFGVDLEAPDRRLPLRAVIELRQVRATRESFARLLKSSQNAAFDAHVLDRVPEAVALLPLPDRRVGSAMDEVRSVWAFEGTAEPPAVVKLRLLRIY